MTDTVTGDRRNEIYTLIARTMNAIANYDELQVALAATRQIFDECERLQPPRPEAVPVMNADGSVGVYAQMPPHPDWTSIVAEHAPSGCEFGDCKVPATHERQISEKRQLYAFACEEHRSLVDACLAAIMSAGWSVYIPSMEPGVPCPATGCNADAIWERPCECGSKVFRCTTHADLFPPAAFGVHINANDIRGANDVEDLDMARLARHIPKLIEAITALGEAHGRVEEALADEQDLRDSVAEDFYTTILPLIRGKVARVGDDDIRKPLIAGLGAEEFKKIAFLITPENLSRVFAAATLAAGEAAGETFKMIRDDSFHTEVMVQCDDFGPIDEEHRGIIIAMTHARQHGAEEDEMPEILARMNERLRKCKRPARAFRKADTVDVDTRDFEHDHGGDAS